jgi:tetratricopeptide (TPR) repeat protein
MKLIDEVLAKEPRRTEALVLKAELLARERKFNEASATIQAAVKADPQSVPANFALGRISALFGQHDEAIRAFNEVLRVNPGNPTAEIELARLHLAAGRLDEAEQFALSAVRKISGSVDAHLILARVNLMKGNVGRAEPPIRALVKALPNSSLVLAELGQLELMKKNRQAARTAFQSALEKSPFQVDALAGLVAMDLEDRQPDAARARLKAAVAKAPRNGPVLVLASRMHQAMGDLSDAEQFARTAIEADANTLDAYSVLGGVYAQQGKIDASIAEYSKLAERRDSVGVETLLGMLLEYQQKPDLAAVRYQKALDLDARAGVAANNLANIRLQQGDLDVALQLAQQARASLPEEPSINDTLGWVLVKKNLPESGIQPLQMAVSKAPTKALYHYHLGLAYAGANQKPKARASLEKALQLDANFSGAAEARDLLAKIKGD